MTLLAGRYTLDVPLGDSDLGTVWNAHDASGTRLVVVTLEDDVPEALQTRFRAHAKALVKTTHPSLVHAIEEGEENGSPFLVLEQLVGESLATRLESGPPPTTSRVVEIVSALADALAAVHAAGIAHGDVEPGNVLLVGEPGKEVPKLIGFALNRASVRQELGARTSLTSLGPVAYAAPEQARGEVMDGPLADQASLAALVYAALGGRPPHIARDAAALATAIGNDKAPQLTLARRELAPFASTIDRALHADPKKRFADIGAFARALKTAGNMAKAIASTPVPLGPRSAIGEPPAPSLPKAATIPRPAAALGGAARPMPSIRGKPTLMGVTIPKPGAPAAQPAQPRVGGGGTRTTEELEIGDLLKPPGEQVPTAIVKSAEPAPTKPTRPTEELDVTGLVAAGTGQIPTALVHAVDPAATKTPQPPPAAPIAPPKPVAKPPAPTDLAPIRSSEELDVGELQAMADAEAAPPPPPALTPPRDSAPELDAADLMSIPPPAPAEIVEAPAAEPLVAFTPSMEKIVAAEAEAGKPVEAEPKAEAKHEPPPPPPKHDAKHDAPPPPPKPDAKAEAKPPPPKPPAPKTEPKPTAPKLAPPSFDAPAASDVEDRPSLDDAGGRPAWHVPAAVAAALVLAVVCWFGYRSMQSDPTTPGSPGHTLTALPTTTEPLPSTTGPVTTVPETTVPVTTVPETTVPVTTIPPTTIAPPATRLTPPATTRPPATTTRPPSTTTRPPATTTRPPSTTTRPPSTTTRPPATTARPPTTGTRPPPTSTTRRPPPTTTTRPTVVSDPGF